MKKKGIVSVVFYVAAILILHLPLYSIGGKNYTVFQGYLHVKDTGMSGLSETAAQLWSGNLTILKLQMIILLLFQLCCVCYIATVFLKKNWHFDGVAIALSAIHIFLFINEGIDAVTDNLIGNLFYLILLMLCGMEFSVSRMMDAWSEAVKEAKENEKKDRLAKEEKQRRLYFPGRYTKLFYRMAWKNFKYDWKDYRLLLICSVVIATLSFTGLGCYQMMAGIHREEYFLIGQGLGRILWDAMIPMGICAVLLMVFMMIYYLKKWIENSSIFVTLGTREKALYGMLTLELLFAFLLSLLLAGLIGNVLILMLKKGMEQTLGDVIFQSVSWVTYLRMIAVMAVIYIVSLMASRDIVREFNLVRAAALRIQREKMPKAGGRVMSVAGVMLIVGSVVLYSQLTRHESIYLLGMFLAGVFFLLRFGGALYLRSAERKRRYIETLMDRNHLYHRSRTTVWYLTALIALYVCGAFYYTFQMVSVMIAEKPEELFPYDFVCIADRSDDVFFEGLKEKYGVEIVQYPMVRVANIDKTESSEGMQPRPQGQQIGISETTYHQLKRAVDKDYAERSLNLDEDGKQIYIVHQQDRSIKAQPIDWAYGSGNPFLHIGLPCPYVKFPSKTHTFIQRKVLAEEIGSLIGSFRQGNLENLVVFSDSYFLKAQEMWRDINIYTGVQIEKKEERIDGVTIRQGPTKLTLLKEAGKDYDAIESEMKVFEENHKEDIGYDLEVSCWYSRQTAIDDMKTERTMRLVANVVVLIVLLMSSFFLLCVKSISEVEEKRGRAGFLKCIGMRRKERVRILKGELYLFYLVPALVTVTAVVCFSLAAFLARMYCMETVKEFLAYAVWIWLGWLVIEGIFVWCMGCWMVRKVEGRDE